MFRRLYRSPGQLKTNPEKGMGRKARSLTRKGKQRRGSNETRQPVSIPEMVTVKEARIPLITKSYRQGIP